MKYLKSYQPFLESNQEKEFIDLISNIDAIAKQSGLDIEKDEEEIAKKLLDEINKNQKVSSEIKEVEQKVKSAVNESHGNLFISLLHEIEPYFEMGEHIETSHDVTPHHLHKETMSEIKKAWHTILKIVHWFSEKVGYIFNLFEKAIFWISSKIFNFTTSYKIGKWTFAAIAVTIIISSVISLGPLVATVTSPLAFISLLFVKWTKIKSIAQSIWSFIKSIRNSEGADSGRLFTPVEFFDRLKGPLWDEITKDNDLSIDAKKLQDLFLNSDDKKKKIISTKLLNILELKFDSTYYHKDDDKFRKDEFRLASKNSKIARMVLSNQKKSLNMEEIEQTPYLRKIFSPILPDIRKTLLWQKETIKDFEIWVNDQYVGDYNKYIDIATDDIEQRFVKDLPNWKEWGDKMADDLQRAMDGPGTDEETLFDLFNQINSEIKFFATYLSFGIRDKSDLIEWLFSDLNKDELLKLSRILDHPWKKGWNVSDILKSTLDDYRSNLPHWSMSLLGNKTFK